MNWPADYHMHTPLCQHAVGEPVEYAQRAVDLGLTEIGFSDHAPMRQDDFDDWRMNTGQMDDYIGKVQHARKAFPQLSIKLALEVDYVPGQEDWVRELANCHPWDYLIGSVHYVTNTWDIDNPRKLSEWVQHEPFEVWTAYFERLTQAAASGLFDIIGHADLPKKFGHRPKEDCGALYDRFLSAAKASATAVELNTAGLRKECQEIYPSRPVLQKAFQLGVEITLGSDAHAPGEVGMDFAAAIELARSVGYTQWRQLTGRKRASIPF